MIKLLDMRTIRRDDGRWYLVTRGLAPGQTQDRVQVQAGGLFALAGRRQPRLDTDIYRDRLDRPRLAIQIARLVRQRGDCAAMLSLAGSIIRILILPF